MAITNVPNQGEFSRDRRANGYLPLTGSPSPVTAPNATRFGHGDPGGSGPLTKMAAPLPPIPNDGRFVGGDPGRSGNYEPSTAMEPGKGAVPVNPFRVSGAIVPSATQQDSAAKKK
jgi:hypothetical protein